MPEPIIKAAKFYKQKNINKWIIFMFCIYMVLFFLLLAIKQLENSVLFATYGILVVIYILSRFLLSFLYDAIPDNGYEPSVTFVVPAMNEGEAISMTLQKIYEVDYPLDKLEVITINDGSTDNTLERMREVKREHPDLTIINWKKNRGKKNGMAKGVRLARGEIIVFIDSDSFVQRDSIRPLVKYFVDPKVGAVCGHTDVYNWDKNYITKMQAARYYIAFEVEKSAEGLFGCVTCCAGCFSAYRREYVMEVLDEWLEQKTLGVDCHYGDDRSLTNFLLKKHKIKFSPEARASTIVPDTSKQFLRQQLRWKKSWFVESFRASFFIWRRNPAMAISFYSDIILTFLSPVILIEALVWDPYMNHIIPIVFISGLVLVSFVYGFYYYIKTSNKSWLWGAAAAWFYAVIMVWQMPYALLTLRDPKWGTR
jgi:hyaluronan synthase